MKKRISLVLAVSTLVLGIVIVFQTRHLTDRKLREAKLQSDLAQSEQEVRDLKASKDRLNNQRSELLQQATEQAKQLSQRVATNPAALNLRGADAGTDATPKSESDPSGFGKFF